MLSAKHAGYIWIVYVWFFTFFAAVSKTYSIVRSIIIAMIIGYSYSLQIENKPLWHQLHLYSHTVNSRYLEVVGNIFYKFKLPEVQINLHFG